MTPKPTLSLEDLKTKALAVNPKKYLTQEHQDYADAVNPSVVLDLIERLENLEKTLRYYANPRIYAFPKTTNYGTSPFRGRIGKSEIFVDLGMKARNALGVR